MHIPIKLPMFTRSQLWVCFLYLLIISTAASAAAIFQSNVAELKPDTVIERDLRGGEAHAYQVSLTTGQFLQVVVMQKGVDVTVTLTGPEGQKMVQVDSPNGIYGPETVAILAAATGNYLLEVTSLDKKAPAGRYEVKIISLRAATATDQEHAAAEKAFAEAQKLRSQRTAVSLRGAIDKYEQAAQFYRSASDDYKLALTLDTIGLSYARLGEFRTALEYYYRALPLFRRVGDRVREANVLNSLGGGYDVMGDSRKALESYEQALALFRQAGDKFLEANTLNNIGKVYSDLLGDWQKALDRYNESLALIKLVGDPRREALARHNIGVVYMRLNDPGKALQYYQQALPLRQAVNDKAGEAATLSNIGLAYSLLGQLPKAIEYYHQALPLRRSAGDRLGEAFTLNFLGRAYASLRELEKALDYHQQALQLRRATEDRRGEAISLGDLGQVYTLMNRLDQAVEYYTQALTLGRSVGDSLNEARILQGLAQAEQKRGNLSVACQQIEAAIVVAENVRGKVGSEELRASYLASKQDAYQFYISLLMRLHRADPTAGQHLTAFQVSERARARSLMEMLAEANTDIRQGVDAKLLERERELTQALNAKARRLIERNTPAQYASLKKEISQLEMDYEQLQAAIRKDNPQYAAITQPQPLKLTEIQQKLLDQDSLLLEYALGEEHSYLWAVTKDSVTVYELPKRELIEQASQRVNELLIARSLRPRLETPAQRSQRIAEADAQLPAAARQLSEMILAPVAVKLANHRLVIVPDGALQYVPFAMLPIAPGKNETVPLIVQNEFVTLPSASTLAVMRKELAGRQPAPKMLAVFADPVFNNNDERAKSKAARPTSQPGSVIAQNAETANAGGRSITHEEKPTATTTNASSGGLTIQRLPFTRQEADRILAVTPGANLKATDFRASRALATGAELGQYRYLHFATHGLLDTERPGLSALVLSLVDEAGQAQDGFLRAHEIYNLHLPAELVVLSACQTGLGKEIKGEGLIGLTRGFMYAGAARVVVSLWNVNDRATAELMAKFYQQMLQQGERPAAALRRAQIEMWRHKQWQAPYYWAAFVLQGEWK